MSKTAKNTPTGPSQEVIGGGLASGVINQIKARENLISQKQKSKEHLLFFNGNGAWARLVSSVNTLTETEATQLAEAKDGKSINAVVGNKNLAYDNVLMGGTLKQGTANDPTSIGGGVSTVNHNPIKLDNQGYVQSRTSEEDSNKLKTSAYHKYDGLGFRPVPGIESVNVTSKGTYGTLREAEVKFKVWDLDDLEVMNALYLRPGYSVLLEWGHSVQLQNDGTLNTNITTYKKFLRDNLDDPMLTFEKDLLKISQDSDYNYDSFVGYISNFNWSLNENGGYDCSIKIIAKGTVLESIKVTFDPSKVYPADQMTRLKDDKGQEERKSIYHKLFQEMQYWVESPLRSGGSINRGNRDAIESGQDVTGGNENLNASLFSSGFQDWWWGSDEVLMSNIDSQVGAEATINANNEEFNKKIGKLADGDYFYYDGDRYSFKSAQTPNAPNTLASLEEEEIVSYLNREFKKYGLVFGEGEIESNGTFDDTAGDNITCAVQGSSSFRGDPDNSIYVEVDNVFDADDYRQTLRIIQFIIYNARIPDEELSEAQLEDRRRREGIAAQNEADNRAAQMEALANNTRLKTSGGDILPVYTNKNFVRAEAQHLRENLNDFVAFRLKDLELKDSGLVDNDNLNEFWIPLYVVLDVYNNYVSLIDLTKSSSPGTNTPGRKLTQFYTGYQDTDPTGDYKKVLKYLTTEDHFSINPMRCILPKSPKLTVLYDSKGEKVKWPDGGTGYGVGVVWKNNFHSNVQGAFAQGLMRGAPDDILNILLPVQFLKDELDKIVKATEDSDKNEGNNVVEWLRVILKEVNNALGGINDLDMFYDDRDDLFYIVDRKVTPALRDLIPVLSLSGTKSVMSEVNIDSQISKDIANMVSIAAQGTSGNSSDNVQTLLKWNAGLLDRHVRFKSQDTEASKVEGTKIEEREAPEDKRLKRWVEDYADFWDEFNGEDTWDNGDFNADLVASISNYHKTYTQKYVLDAYYKNADDPKPPPGTIPIELSFKTMGIGGIKIGQAFQIEQGLLPARYAENFGYIITGLSHDIEGSKWTTNIKTQFYNIKPATDAEVEAHKRRSNTDSEEYVRTDNSPESSDGNTGPVVVDQSDPIDGTTLDYDKIKQSVVAKGFVWDERDYAINIVGIRNYSVVEGGKLKMTNKYIDLLTMSWTENGLKKSIQCAATTVPGKKWLKDGHEKDKYKNGRLVARKGDLLNTTYGAGIVKEGQYPEVYRRGTHRGYNAFQQKGDFYVYRDNNRDAFFDFDSVHGPGRYSMNLHRSKAGGTSTLVNGFSGGCQVLATDADLQTFLKLAKQHENKTGEKRFMYTLITSNDLV